MNVDTARCPSWCVKEHQGPEIISHEGAAHRVELLGSGQDLQFLEVRSVQYLPIDAARTSSAPSMVEIAHHSGDRYRIFNLTGASARTLAHLLLASAEALDRDQAPPADVQEEILSGNEHGALKQE